MELNLIPQMADTTVFEGEGGGYYAWTATKFPVLSQAEVGAGKLVLHPRGFALPHYADANKIGYVVQGTCTVGIILPNNVPEEKVVIISKGDVIPLQMGTISWWFNAESESDLTIIFLGETTRSYNLGEFDYFFLTGSIGILGGFSTEFITKIYGFDESDSLKLAKSQTNPLILKVDEQINMPHESNTQDKEQYVLNLENLMICSSDAKKKLAVVAACAGGEKFPLIDRVGLSPSLVRLEPNSVLNPSYNIDGSHRIFYVTKGSGRIQIVGLNGNRALDTATVEEGQLFVVPKFFVAALLADDKGIEFFSVSTSPRPVLGQLAGETSTYKALSSSILQTALNVSPEFVKIFKSKLNMQGQ